MDRIAHIEKYLRARLAAETARGTPAVAGSSPMFITISRQSGTGAHSLADSLVSRFSEHPERDLFAGWHVYDASICEMVAQDPRFEHALDALREEEYGGRRRDVVEHLVRGRASQRAVMDRVFVVVRAIASMGKAIIIGRGGAQVTRDMQGGTSLRLVAPEPYRVAAARDRYALPEAEVLAEIRRRDASRERMIRDIFDASIADPSEYDVTWNVGTTVHAEIAEAVTGLVQTRSAAV